MSKPNKSKGSASKIFRFFNRIVKTDDKDKSGGFVKYGLNNKFPQDLIKELNESGTATQCIDKLSEYSYAYGLTDEVLGNTKVNGDQTLNQLLKEAFRIICTFRGIAIHISRKPDGSVGQSKLIPFENVRKSITDGFYVYNETFSCDKYNKEKDILLTSYRGKVINPDLIDPNGEILYYFEHRPMQSIYPIPSYYSSIEDINTDSELSKYELETVTNGFLPSGLLEVVGEIDDETEDDAGKTEKDYYEETLSSFTGAVKDESGASGRASLMVFYKKTKDELSKYTPFANEGILNASDSATKRIANKVARSFGVPPFLINLGESVGFSTQIIQDQITLFNNSVFGIQTEMMEVISMIYDGNFKMTQLTPVKNIDPSLYQDLTPNERREIIGYKAITDKATSTVSLAQTLGVGGTQSLMSVLQDTVMSTEQKKNVLIVVFNLNEQDATRLTTIPTITPLP